MTYHGRWISCVPQPFVSWFWHPFVVELTITLGITNRWLSNSVFSFTLVSLCSSVKRKKKERKEKKDKLLINWDWTIWFLLKKQGKLFLLMLELSHIWLAGAPSSWLHGPSNKHQWCLSTSLLSGGKKRCLQLTCVSLPQPWDPPFWQWDVIPRSWPQSCFV